MTRQRNLIPDADAKPPARSGGGTVGDAIMNELNPNNYANPTATLVDAVRLLTDLVEELHARGLVSDELVLRNVRNGLKFEEDEG